MTRYADVGNYLRNTALPTIRAHGWMCAGHVLPSGQESATITYTAGLTEAGMAELAMAGLPHDPAAVLLNFLARMHLEQTLHAGDTVPMPNATELLLINAPGVFGPIARALYGRRARFLQVLWPDPEGRYPTDPLWSQRNVQPVFDQPLPAYLAPDGDGMVAELDEAARRRQR